MKHFIIAFLTIFLFFSGCCIGEFSGDAENLFDDLSGKVVDSKGVPLFNVQVSYSYFYTPSQNSNSNKTFSTIDGEFYIKNGFPFTNSYDFKPFPNCGEKTNVKNSLDPFLLIFKISSNDSTVVGIFYDSLEVKSPVYKNWFNHLDTIIFSSKTNLGEFGKNHKLPNIILR